MVGQGSDTLISVSFTRPSFVREIERLEEEEPTDLFAAVDQNAWFVKIKNEGGFEELSLNEYEINGGGQLASSNSASASV